MMSIIALMPASRDIISWWSRDPTGIVKTTPKNAKFTWKTAKTQNEQEAGNQRLRSGRFTLVGSSQNCRRGSD